MLFQFGLLVPGKFDQILEGEETDAKEPDSPICSLRLVFPDRGHVPNKRRLRTTFSHSRWVLCISLDSPLLNVPAELNLTIKINFIEEMITSYLSWR